MAPQPPPALEGKKRRIAVMTSGGDSPGMNGAVRAVVRMAIERGCEAYCIYEGYQGLVDGGDKIKRMSWSDVRGWLSEGGTLIGTARCMAFYERPGRLTAAKNMILNGIDALIICGGDGSLTGADKFRAEWPSLLQELVEKKELTAEQVKPFEYLNIVGLVGSIDNDMSGTDATIGCFSALGKICELIDYVEATALSHSRAFVIEVMGRHCGWLALMAGVATGADFVFIPEKPRPDNWREEMCTIVQKEGMGKRKTIVIVAEGAHDQDGQKITSEMIKELLSDKSGLALDTRVTTLGHVQRGGNACAYDRMLSTLQGVEAVNAVLEAQPGDETPFIAIDENKITRKPLVKAVEETKKVAKAIEAKDFDRAMGLRDTEFTDFYNSYMTTTTTDLNTSMMLPPEKRMKIAIVHVGAPAGGVNAATRAAVAYCLTRGHTPIAIHNGFAGFARHHGDEPLGAVRPFDWLEVDGWASKGGSEIGMNRELPNESGMELVASLFKQYKFDGLFIIGGFEGFHALSQLRQARDKYPSLCIPMTLLPATISNNVPGTEYSLGSDTCLNELVNYCDKIKQSASASRRRVFVIETQGGRCGYVATLAGLSVGAVAVYTPEEGINIEMLSADIKHLKEVFSEDSGQSRAGRLMLVNEKSSRVYSAKLIADMVREEANERFEARDSIPGHVQQGGTPSPMDRTRAVRLAIKCIEHLESFASFTPSHILADEMSSSTIGIKGAKVVFSPMKVVEEQETDWKNRRAKEQFWIGLKDTVDVLSRRPAVKKPESPLVGFAAKDRKRGI